MSNCPTASRWIKFANSLRLRLAMRVSNVNKALAASEAKKALENSCRNRQRPYFQISCTAYSK